MQDKDITEQFIRDLKSVDYYNKKIIGINLKLEELATIMQGVSSPNMDGIVVQGGGRDYQHTLINNLSKERELELERAKWVRLIEDIEITFNKFEYPLQKMMTELYLLKQRHATVAKNNGYARNYMYKKINKAILKVLKN